MGLHVQAIEAIRVEVYVDNVKRYIELMLPHCSYIFWVTTTAPESNGRVQKIEKTRMWNDRVTQMIQSVFHQSNVVIIDVYEKSLVANHLDNVHMDQSWYQQLNKLILSH